MTLSNWPHEFPKGYKQYRVLCEMQSKNGLTYTEIIKFAFELSNEYEYTHKRRGYWSGAFQEATPGIYGSSVTSWITRLCTKGSDGKYRPNLLGMDKIDDLALKFKGINAKCALSMKKMARAEEVLKVTPPQPVPAQARVACSNGIVLDMSGSTTSLSKDEIPTKNREKMGFKIDDEVIFYRNFNRELGEGYIQSIKEQSIRISDKIEISIGLENSTIPQITYISSEHRFVEMSGDEITIALKTV